MRLPDSLHSRVVLVGASAYDSDDLADLPSVSNNLSDLLELLTSPDGGGIQRENCVVIDRPRLAEVGRAIDRAAREASDTFVLYFAGHGMRAMHGGLFLALPETDSASPQWCSLDYAHVRQSVASSPAKNRIVILDCCLAGRAIDLMGSDPSLDASETEIYGTYTLTATGKNLPAIAPVGRRNTAFTEALLRIAQSGIPDEPELVSLDALFRQLCRLQASKGLPEPHQSGTDLIHTLALFRNKSRPDREPLDVQRASDLHEVAIETMRGLERDTRARLKTSFLMQLNDLEEAEDGEVRELSKRYCSVVDSFLTKKHGELTRITAGLPSEFTPPADASPAESRRLSELAAFSRDYGERLQLWLISTRGSVADLAMAYLSFNAPIGDVRRLSKEHLRAQLAQFDPSEPES